MPSRRRTLGVAFGQESGVSDADLSPIEVGENSAPASALIRSFAQPSGFQNCGSEAWHDPAMRSRLNTYTAYSIGCAIVWAVILALVATAGTKHTAHKVLLVFAGWVLGWTSATIARYVYPPPKRGRRAR